MDLSDKAALGTYSNGGNLNQIGTDSLSTTVNGPVSTEKPPPLDYIHEQAKERSLPLLSYHGGNGSVSSTRDHSSATAFQPFRPTSAVQQPVALASSNDAASSPRSLSIEPYHSSRFPFTAADPYGSSAAGRIGDPYTAAAGRYPETYPVPPLPHPDDYWNR